MSEWDGMNRRKFPRVNYPCIITMRHEGNAPEMILTHTENVGIGGLCVIINKNISMFAPVEVEIDLLDTSNPIKCKGKVVWIIRRKAEEKKKPLFYDLGVEFADIKEEDEKRLDDIVKRLIKLGQQTPYS